jgi:hypothetical protein
MAKELVATRVEPEMKREIKREAEKIERDEAWLLRRVLEIGWPIYKSQKGRKAA